MTAITQNTASAVPNFCQGIQYFGEVLPDFQTYGIVPAIASGQKAVANPTDTNAVYQTLLAADALRYLTLQISASKASGHPGGFASQAEAMQLWSCLDIKTLSRKWDTMLPVFIVPCF